jgi:predicted Fe-Mo cluster-binding NifX family protein
MKICITSDGDNLNANVDLRFGRCPCFILYDTNTDSFEAIPNTNVSGMGGVGSAKCNNGYRKRGGGCL